MTRLKLLFIISLLPVYLKAQEDIGLKYRRSSLYPLMINEPERMHADVIQKTFSSTPIPEKFNDHRLNIGSVSNGIKGMTGSREEKIKLQKNHISYVLDSSTLARDMVAKWFNRDSTGCFNTNLLIERGNYDATEMDVELAMQTKRGMAVLGDAGEELINNTFVIVNDFDFVNKEKVADGLRTGLEIVKTVIEIADEFEEDEEKKNDNKDLIDAIDGASTVVQIVGKGYVVRTTSYLYQLVWNDSIAAVFYENYWMNKDSYNESKKNAFENSNAFKLKFIGQETAWADLQSTIFTEKTEEELISIATVRAADKVIAKLQRKYEVFRTKTPLCSTEPIGAKIGLKEGVKRGDKFEVVEQLKDRRGRTKYKRRGTIKVNKHHIWDNRYMASEAPKKIMGEFHGNDFTIFKGKNKYYKGMLIRQIN